MNNTHPCCKHLMSSFQSVAISHRVVFLAPVATWRRWVSWKGAHCEAINNPVITVKRLLTGVARRLPLRGTSAAASQSFIHNSRTTIQLLPAWLPRPTAIKYEHAYTHYTGTPSFGAVFRTNQAVLFQQLMWSVFSNTRGWHGFEWASFQSLDHAKPQLFKRFNTP